MVSQNISNALAFLQHQDSALKTVGNIMERMSELQALYADNTKSTSDKVLYSTEFSALTSSLVSMSDDTVNGLSIFASTNVKVSINDTLSTTADYVDFGSAGLSTVIGLLRQRIARSMLWLP